jgi:hypothetical protein
MEMLPLQILTCGKLAQAHLAAARIASSAKNGKRLF